jgi:hypothetical protein
MFILVLNQNNLVPDGQNNKLVYKFPNSVVLTDKYVAVSSISMFYSWNNITVVLNNNTINYQWVLGTTISITIPDGLYEIADLNNFIQFTCLANGTYWTSLDGTIFYYPFEIVVNSNRYAVQLNTYYIPNGSASFLPGGAGWPGSLHNTVVIFPALFNQIVGYPANFTSDGNLNNTTIFPVPSSATNYAAKLASGTISYLSNVAPQVQPNSNILFSMTNINNPYSQPSSIIYSLSPSVAVGEQINEKPPNFMWTKFIDGTYNELRLTFLGTDNRPILLQDSNMTILLTIRDKDEAFLGNK